MDASVRLYEVGREQRAMVLLRAILESATDAAIVYDAAQDVFLANHKAVELHGLPPAGSRFDEWGLHYDAYWPDGSKVARHDHPFARALDRVRVPGERLEIHPRIGAVRHVDVRAEPLYDAGGDMLGAMAVFRDVESTDSAEETVRMRNAITQMTRENERLSGELESALAELQFSRARILSTANLERRRIERDLHDGAQQRLVALRVRLGLAQELLREDPVRGAAMFGDLAADADAALDDIRLLARGVYPSVLADRGLGDALRAAARSCPLQVTVDARRIARYPEDIETAVYFTCVEALQNAAKHSSGDTSVQLSVTQGDDLRFAVVDTGAGFKANGRPKGRGLANMRDRVESVGGTLSVESKPGLGTRVSGSIPISPPHSH